MGACRKEYGPSKPFKGMNISGSLHMTIQTAVLIETLHELGANVRWASCNIFSTQDHAAAAVAKGREFEEKYAKDKSLPDPSSTTNPEFKCVLQVIKDSIQRDATKWTRMSKFCKGVSEETTTGVHRLKEMAAKGELLFPAINVNDCVTKSKF